MRSRRLQAKGEMSTPQTSACVCEELQESFISHPDYIVNDTNAFRKLEKYFFLISAVCTDVCA